MHVVGTIPPQSSSAIESSSSSASTPSFITSREAGSTDFAVSPFLLLPDSFGDIYVGEVFSAYIAVVNGNQEAPYDEVSLAIRLQTTNATTDLVDTRASSGMSGGQAKVTLF
jgi:hypothetical protein